ncbi:sodium:proton antiporter [Clostridium sp. D2Q-14]|uniref:Na+/H+ antiporter NhaC family protein n=1 Tax=Anaeromonas gelatinilytica TaxID=2683194 RepID=UPI00193C0B44|nr:Na+/H+ antiporter NhaC family protein [Anaeromonas gelatinilytica]MBS4535187.1 sodium:proton antiporter [Anaeromonas gelatinilytica]
MNQKKKLDLIGGGWSSFLPFGVFILIAIYISILKAPDVRGMWVGALVGIMLTFFLAKDKEKYADVIIEGMADKMAIVPIACWIFAGVFASVLRASGLVEGIIWVAYNVGAQGRLFVIITFLASALFATAAGTGFGTIVAGMAVLYPAGALLGANPLALIGAIIGGGTFGDNLAPLSDTTISSAASQGTDVGGVVRSRLKYAIIAGSIALILFGIFGGGNSIHEVPYETLSQYMNPIGLVMLIPAGLVIFIAIKGAHIITATTIGTVLATIVAEISGLNSISNLLYVEDGAAKGLLVDGMSGMIDICILALLIFACINVMKQGGGDKVLIGFANKFVKSVRGFEISVIVLIIAMSAIMGLNAPPILALGSFYAKPLGEKFNIHPYRRANLLDATACTLVYALPWTPALLLTKSLAEEANAQFGSLVPVFETTKITPWIFYSWAMLAVMIISVLSGWGMEYIGKNGEPVKKLGKEMV